MVVGIESSFDVPAPDFTDDFGENNLSFYNVTDNITNININDQVVTVRHDHFMRHSIGWTVIFSIMYTVIFFTGIVGNLLVLLVIRYRPQMRTVTNLFVGNLAFADLLVSVLCVPGTLIANLITPWILGPWMCKLVPYVQGVSICASTYSLAVVSLSRCIGILKPLGLPRDQRKRHAVIIIVLIWLISMVLISPWAFAFTLSPDSANNQFVYCVEIWKNIEHGKLYFLIVNLFLGFLLPLLVIIVCNVSVWYEVNKRQLPHSLASTDVVETIHRRTRHGVRNMLLAVSLAFSFCWLPLYILVAYIKFFPVGDGFRQEKAIDILLPIVQWFGAGSSSINPFLYAFSSKTFRKMSRDILSTWLPFARDFRAIPLVEHNPDGDSRSAVNKLVIGHPKSPLAKPQQQIFEQTNIHQDPESQPAKESEVVLEETTFGAVIKTKVLYGSMTKAKSFYL